MQANRKGYRFLAAALVLVLAVLAAAPALADELEEKQQQLTNVQQQIEAQQRKAELARRKEQTIAEQLRAIQQELDTAEDEFEVLMTNWKIPNSISSPISSFPTG